MNTRRNKVVVTLFAVLALVFTGCQEVEDLATGVTPSDVKIVSVSKDIADADLNSNSIVTFTVTVRNDGGLDSAGVFVQSVIDNVPAGFVATGILGSAATPAIAAEKTVTITWDASAGAHSAVFYIKSDSTSATDEGNQRIDLQVAVADLAVASSEEVAVEESSKEITTIVSGGQSIAEITDAVETLLQDDTKSEDEIAVLETIKIAKDENLKIAVDAAPTAVTFEDTAVSALFIPLADDAGTTDDNSFLVSITTEVEEVVSSSVTSAGIENVTEKKKVALPILVKKDENNVTTLKNGLGSIVVDADGNITVPTTRAFNGEFWSLVAAQLDAAAKEFAIEAQTNYLAALVKFIGKVTSVIAAYELQSAVTNEKPVITIEASKGKTFEQVGNDRLITTFDVYTASVADDKDGATFANGFATETSVANGATEYTFTATDTDGATASVTATIGYTTQTIVDFHAHDQGAVN